MYVGTNLLLRLLAANNSGRLLPFFRVIRN